MKNSFSDRAILIFGVSLLIFNLGFQLIKQPSTISTPLQSKNSDSIGQAQYIEQLLQSGLMAPYLRWDKHLTVTDEDNQAIPFHQILGTGNKLVFRFSELSCNSCLNREIENLHKISDQIGAENILFLATYQNIRDLMVFKRINKVQFKVYNIASDQLSLPDAGSTLIFIANAQNGAMMPFLPDKESGLLSNRYYQFVAPLMNNKTVQ